MSENDKREKKRSKKRKNKDSDVTTNVEEHAETNIKIKKVKKNKKDKQREDEINPEPEETIKVKKRESVKFTPETIDNEKEPDESPKKRKKEDTRLPTEEELLQINKPENIKDVGSKRQQKREKYEKLKSDNKLKQDSAFQEKALNYLSRWKHNRSEWKFEKLRQVWLQNHMFDSEILPEKFFDTLVEYFGGSKGHIRQILINTCMKIVGEAEENEKEDAVDDVKFKRARTLLQLLQE